MLQNFFTRYLSILEKDKLNFPLISYAGRDYTYNEILFLTNKTIKEIQKLDSSQNPIAIELKRSPEYYAAVLACINLGRPFIPLDNRYPEQLKQHIFSQASARILISSKNHETIFKQIEATTEIINEFNDIFAIFYTSGSTNTPKGVKLSYTSIENRFNWMWDLFPYQQGEKQLFKANTIFIDSLWECFGAVLKGVPTFIADHDLVHEPRDLLSACLEQNITRITVVPSYLKAMLNTGFTDIEFIERTKTIKYWIVSGERFDNAVAKQLFNLAPNAKILNLYGSTEVMGDVTYHLIDKNSFIHESIPIGKSIINNSVLLIDGENQAIHDNGIQGSIVVSGQNLTPGYIDAEANDKTFIQLELDGSDKRWYLTGDTGVIHDDYFVYTGRRDRAVKINGSRINLDVIELIVRKHPHIFEAAVIEDELGSVCIFVVFKGSKHASVEKLKTYINDKYIGLAVIPKLFIMETLPKTISGKIHYISLRDSLKSVSSSNNTALTSELDNLTEIIQRILATPKINADDNLFNMGLHSLNAIQLAATIRKSFKKNIKIKQIFEKPTIKDIYDILFID